VSGLTGFKNLQIANCKYVYATKKKQKKKQNVVQCYNSSKKKGKKIIHYNYETKKFSKFLTQLAKLRMRNKLAYRSSLLLRYDCYAPFIAKRNLDQYRMYTAKNINKNF